MENQVETVKYTPEKAKQNALAKLDLIRKWQEFRRKAVNKLQADYDFVKLHNSSNSYLFSVLGKISRGSLHRWKASLDGTEDYTRLIPNYKYVSVNEYRTCLTDEEIKIFMGLLLHPNRICIGKAIALTKYKLKEQGQSFIPADITFRRYAKWFKDNNYDKWVLARDGEKALSDKVEPYIKRDASLLDVGDILVADGHKLAFQVINPFTGKPCRATLVGFLDWKSTALVGYEIMLEENTQCIASALRNAIINLGKVPKFVYQDNGKAFKAKYFIENGLSGLFTNLGIQPVYAKPYNAKAKPIERLFRELQDSCEVLLPSYTGTSIIKKPAQLKRNEKLHKSLYKVNVPTLEQVVNFIGNWVQKYHYEQPCPHIAGETIGKVLESGKGDGVNIETLDDLMMVREIKKIYRNGILFLKNNYYDEALFGYKKEVIIKYSLFNLSSIKVYKLNGEFICEAKRIEPIHPLANYLGEVKDIEELKQKTRIKKKLEKQTEQEYINQIKRNQVHTPLLTMDLIEKQEEVEINDFKLAIKEEIQADDFNGCFNTRFEKYEYLMKQDKLTKKEQEWILEYKSTSEYEQIYGDDNKEVFNA